MPGTARDIGIGADGMVWVLGITSYYGGYDMYWWSGADWVFSQGTGVAISVARGGKPWVVNSFHDTFRSR